MQDMSRKSHKRELFRVAFKMFILKSFDGVSIPDIEKATGFTRGTIFHYADTKQDLFRQVVEYYVLERQDIERKIQVADGCTLLMTEEREKTLWDEALVVLDTNSICAMYRMTKDTQKTMLEILEYLKDKLWIPGHVLYEYQKNRIEVIKEPILRCKYTKNP